MPSGLREREDVTATPSYPAGPAVPGRSVPTCAGRRSPPPRRCRTCARAWRRRSPGRGPAAAWAASPAGSLRDRRPPGYRHRPAHLPRPCPPPPAAPLTQDQHHLPAQAVVDVQRFLAIIVLLAVAGVGADDGARYHLRHGDGGGRGPLRPARRRSLLEAGTTSGSSGPSGRDCPQCGGEQERRHGQAGLSLGPSAN